MAQRAPRRRLAAVRAGLRGADAAAATDAPPAWAWDGWSAGLAPPLPVGWLSRWVVANGIRIHYYRTPGGSRADGSPKPVLFCAHGYADCGLSWWYLAQDLVSDFELVLADARGHGMSDPPTAETPTDAQAEDLAALITALGL